MEFSDNYYTLKVESKGLYKEKGSKFISYAYPVESEQEVEDIISSLKKRYHDARHHCFAWKLGMDDNRFRINDDGEPSGTAGKPILGQIRSFNLTNVLIIVIRYFGGIKLGTGGLIRAYKSAAEDALINGEIIEKFVQEVITLSFKYEIMNSIMRIIKEENLKITDQSFGMSCSIAVCVRYSDSERVKKRFKNIIGIELQVGDEL
ncbi:YigZ family protein [Marinilabiliaceae bacterium ANBcel2]|nr:YigZ family protein [Marinilabiliaceae bacterium ANBcel2]